jgi:hypothetical protein
MARTIVETESVTCDVCGRVIGGEEWMYEVRVRPMVDNCVFQGRVLDLCKDCFASFKETYEGRRSDERD